jgi:hypothetical protein
MGLSVTCVVETRIFFMDVSSGFQRIMDRLDATRLGMALKNGFSLDGDGNGLGWYFILFCLA